MVEFLKVFLILILQAYLLGFAFIDNYNELSKLTVKESEKVTRKFAGVTIAIGGVAYLLLLLPIAGTIIAPVFGGVAATLAMFDIEKPNLGGAKSEEIPIALEQEKKE